MKIQLIHPPADEGYDGPEAQWLKSAPIGLELIAGAIGDKHDVQIIDGNNMPLEQIFARIEGDYVGVSDWYSKHENALKILAEAKKRGAVTLIGGPNATHLAERILKNHPSVDYAITGDGEDATRRIIAGEEPSKIPNLVYRNGTDVRRNPTENVALNQIFNLEHIINPHYSKENPFPISSIRGCIKAETDKRCSFCSMDHRLKVMGAENVWKQIDLLNSKYGFNYFFETGDSFIVGRYPQILLERRPEHLRDVRFRIYASPNQIDERTTEVLRQLNVQEIFLGVESTDQNILTQAGKKYSVEQIGQAISSISSAGIELQVPFIYGLPGESERTMKNTHNYARDLMTRYPKTKLLVSTPLPLIGSALFEDLRTDSRIRKEYLGDLDADDSFDYEALSRLQTKYRTSVEYAQMNQYVANTRALAMTGNVAGCGILKNE
jgi:radical SAM superfamily enzyme YgiQ (UPF0313 family)